MEEVQKNNIPFSVCTITDTYIEFPTSSSIVLEVCRMFSFFSMASPLPPWICWDITLQKLKKTREKKARILMFKRWISVLTCTLWRELGMLFLLSEYIPNTTKATPSTSSPKRYLQCQERDIFSSIGDCTTQQIPIERFTYVASILTVNCPSST